MLHELFFSAGLAQLVVHLICNQGVGGSNPSAGKFRTSEKIRRPPETSWCSTHISVQPRGFPFRTPFVDPPAEGWLAPPGSSRAGCGARLGAH